MPVARHRRDARRVNKHGETWDQTVARVHAQFPSTNETRDWWYEQLESRQLRETLLHDVVNVDRVLDSDDVRRGSRPRLPKREVERLFQQLRGNDYSTLPFHEAFQALAGDRSRRHLAANTGLSKDQVQRLLAGAIAPSGHEMERVAAAFGKKGSYFREYRTAVLCALSARLLDDNPERSAVLIQKLTALL